MAVLTMEMSHTPSFLAAMHELNIPRRQPGIVLAINTLINITYTANNNVLDCIINGAGDANNMKMLLEYLQLFSSKLFATFLRMTGSEHGWIDGLEAAWNDILFAAVFKVQSTAERLYTVYAKANGVGMLPMLAGRVHTIKGLLEKLRREHSVRWEDEHKTQNTSWTKKPPEAAASVANSYEMLEVLFRRLQTYSAPSDLVDNVPVEKESRLKQYYAIIDRLIERVLVPVDEIEDHGNLIFMAHKIKLVRQVEQVIERMDKALEDAAAVGM